MALFGKKKVEEKAVKAPKAKAVSAVPANKSTGKAPAMPHPTHVILVPRITEKATVKADAENVYVFEIAHDANKTTVSQAIKAMYNVVPVRVNIARNPGKTLFRRGKTGFTSGVKKAYVYVKKGEKIEIV
ncbi:MAG TPA: 50S ribosomal protein L23 [Candidatus Nanoarchaeia archaeon]|nr:50S ribosomal protein L23 [Candidatus Nanoarchaeia archaeon]